MGNVAQLDGQHLFPIYVAADLCIDTAIGKAPRWRFVDYQEEREREELEEHERSDIVHVLEREASVPNEHLIIERVQPIVQTKIARKRQCPVEHKVRQALIGGAIPVLSDTKGK